MGRADHFSDGGTAAVLGCTDSSLPDNPHTDGAWVRTLSSAYTEQVPRIG